MTPEEKLLRDDGLKLHYITEQTEELCLVAIKQNPLAIKYVTKQTELMVKEVIMQDWELLRYCHIQNEEVIRLALMYGLPSDSKMIKPHIDMKKMEMKYPEYFI